MLKRQIIDCIYLNKRGKPMDTSAWAYYRVSSFGAMSDSIELHEFFNSHACYRSLTTVRR